MTADAYSPERRTALVLSGVGADGAYHGGVLRALHEAGVKVDIVAGRGIGAVGALFAAVDGAQRLWDEKGFWRAPGVGSLYAWRPTLRLLAWACAAAVAVVALPLATIVAGLAVFPIDFVLKMVGVQAASGLVVRYLAFAEAMSAPEALPTWLPRIVVLVLGAAAAIAVAAAPSLRRGARGRLRWRLLRAPLSAHAALEHCWAMMWDLVRGAARLKRPTPVDLGRRYTEMLAENIGQPGFRELLIVTHDIDARRDLLFALVAEPRRTQLVRRGTTEQAGERRAEVMDLAGVGRDHLPDALSAALAVPVVTEPHAIVFGADSYWRGETHRLCDRPASLPRLVDELAALDVEQLILVSAAPDPAGPHALAGQRLDARGSVGEYLQSFEAATVRDLASRSAAGWPRLFLIRPSHNPIGPFDFHGGFDTRSNRRQPLLELMGRGYEDAYHQFIEPIVGASGDRMG